MDKRFSNKRSFKHADTDFKDLDKKPICEGQIVAVRYVWNSYVGIIRFINGSFCLHFSQISERLRGSVLQHDLDTTATYQILGHIDTDHVDYTEAVLDWAQSEEDAKCPTKIRVYEEATA